MKTCKRSLRIRRTVVTLLLAALLLAGGTAFPGWAVTAHASSGAKASPSPSPAPSALQTDIPYTEAELRQILSLLSRAPNKDEYLETFVLGSIDNNNKSVYGYSSPTSDGTNIITIPDYSELTVVGFFRPNNRYCVIVNDKNKACWVDAGWVSLTTAPPAKIGAPTPKPDESRSSGIPYTDDEIRLILSLLYQMPNRDEYLDTFVSGEIDNNNRAAHGLAAPNPGSNTIITIPDHSKLTVVGFFRPNNRYCVIVNDKNKACWVDAARVSLSPPEPAPKAAAPQSSKIPYTEDEIRQLLSLLYQAPNRDEYLDTFVAGEIDNNNRAAYGFAGPNKGSNTIITIPDHSKLTVVGFFRANNRYCVIVNDKNKACWVDAGKVSLIME